MMFMSRNEVNEIRSKYKMGTVVKLISMDDPYTYMPSGMTGTVSFVDDAGQIHVNWSNGSSLAIIPGVDSFTVVNN